MDPIRTDGRIRVLAVVSRFKWQHIDYLAALAERFDLMVAWTGEAHQGAVAHAMRRGLRLHLLGRTEDDGLKTVRARLSAVVLKYQPDVIHVMYYFHEQFVFLAREVAKKALILFESRDPLTTLVDADVRSKYHNLERAALRLSNAQIFVSTALRRYYENLHGLDLSVTSIRVPHAFAQRNAGPLSRKLSRDDGKTHLALVGTVDTHPGHGRWYGDIIRRLVSLGFIVHSHFHETEGISLDPYLKLASELDDYHFHPTVSFLEGTALSDMISRYDLMGVFHELEAPHHDESATLAVCMPTKAVCGWFHGAIPVVCFPHYRALSEWIGEFGIGFVINCWDDLRSLRDNPAAIAQSTGYCIAVREMFSNEWNAARIHKFVESRLGEKRKSIVAPAQTTEGSSDSGSHLSR